jgi:hypothetical protein
MTPKTAPKKPVALPQGSLLAGTLASIRGEGYGFIRLDENDDPDSAAATEYFVHVADFPSRPHWKVGQPVFFQSAPARVKGKAPQAINVTLR